MGSSPVVLALPLFNDELDLVFFLNVFAIVAGLSPSLSLVVAVSPESSSSLVGTLSSVSSVI